MRVVDLTQVLGPDTVLWPGGAFATESLAEHAADGYYSRAFTSPEHAGTHLDAPAHFVADGARVEEIPAERLVVPCVLVDVAADCGDDPGHQVDADDLLADEERHGMLPRGGAVLVRTGWDRFTGDAGRYLGGAEAGDLDFPGLTPAAAELIVERGCVGLGIDTLGVDPGSSSTFAVHHITLPAGLWHLEGLVNLGALPARGATLFVGALKLADGSGTPARVLALLGGAPGSQPA